MMKMTRKKLFGILVASVTALSISTTAFATLNETSATEIAEKWVPAGSIHLSTETDMIEYEVEFLNKETNIKYEIELNRLTEKVTEVKTKLKNNPGSQIVKLNEDAVKTIVWSEFPGATIRNIKLDRDNGYQKYEVKFTTDTVRGEIEINPETGVIIERELKY